MSKRIFQKIDNLGKKVFLHLFRLNICAILIVVTLSCSLGRGDLTRDSALKLIEESEKFKVPAAIVLKDENDLMFLPNSSDETESEAQSRAMDIYLSSNRGIAVLRHLGYVEVKAALVKPGKVEGSGTFASRRPWVFKIEPELTNKGRDAAMSQGVTENKAVILGRRKVIEVTGIRKEGIQAAVDFTWKAVPTEAGEAFDPTNNTFKSLPPELQGELTKTQGIGPFGSSMIVNWNETYKSTAGFQKYDDGWRLTSIRF